MKRDPLRVAGWSVVAMGALVFAGAAWRIAHSGPPAPPLPAAPVSAPVQTLASPATPATTTTVAPTRSPEPVEANYFGNTNSHRFHRASCRYANCKNCTAKFATREDAIAAGYRPGGCCNP